MRPPRASRPGLLAPPGLGPPFNTSLWPRSYLRRAPELTTPSMQGGSHGGWFTCVVPCLVFAVAIQRAGAAGAADAAMSSAPSAPSGANLLANPGFEGGACGRGPSTSAWRAAGKRRSRTASCACVSTCPRRSAPTWCCARATWHRRGAPLSAAAAGARQRSTRLRARISKVGAPTPSSGRWSPARTPPRGLRRRFRRRRGRGQRRAGLRARRRSLAAPPVTVCLDDVELNDPRFEAPPERAAPPPLRVRVNQVGYLRACPSWRRWSRRRRRRSTGTHQPGRQVSPPARRGVRRGRRRWRAPASDRFLGGDRDRRRVPACAPARTAAPAFEIGRASTTPEVRRAGLLLPAAQRCPHRDALRGTAASTPHARTRRRPQRRLRARRLAPIAWTSAAVVRRRRPRQVRCEQRDQRLDAAQPVRAAGALRCQRARFRRRCPQHPGAGATAVPTCSTRRA